jgi:HSP20 family protein
MNRLFDDLYRAPAAGQEGLSNLIEAHMDVSETENEYRVRAELPGVNEEDIDVKLEDDVLTIRCEKRFERSEGGEKEDYHFVERSYGTIQRSLRLPTHVDADRVDASYENGVLKITLPKNQQQERSRRIQIGGQAKQGQGGQKNNASQAKDDKSSKA